MNNQASVMKNDTHKLLWNFYIQTNYLISARLQDLIINKNKKKRTCNVRELCVPTDHRLQMKESEKRNKYLVLARKLKKLGT